MIIKTSVKSEEDLDLLSNTLNAQAGRFLYSDPALYYAILRAQAAIDALTRMLNEKGEKKMNIEEAFEQIASGEIKWIYCDKSKKYYRVTAKEITEEQYKAEAAEALTMDAINCEINSGIMYDMEPRQKFCD